MLRRNFLPTLAAPLAAQSTTSPNIVVIYADDLGVGDLGCYGNPVIKTPNLDKMAAEGMRFTQFYSASPYCSPSRAALLTGRLPIRSGMNVVLFPDSTGGIQDSEVTTAEMLKQRGYATACVGKWHLGHLPQYSPLKHGFDSYYGIPYSNDMSPATAPPGLPAPRKTKWPPLPVMRNNDVELQEPDQSRITGLYTDEAIKFLRASTAAKKPFYLYLPHTMPHWPLAASAKFKGKSVRGLYGDAVEELDWSVGEIFRTLRELKQDRNTFVFFSSDNGPARYLNQEGGAAGMLRDGKATTWEGGQREPALAWFPGKIAPSVSHAFGTTMDILPTVAKMTGGSLPTDRVYDGRDLSDVLFRNGAGREPEMYYYLAGELRAARKGPWKLHVITNQNTPVRKPAAPVDPPLLYHLDHDPGEEWNLAAKHPEVVRDMLAFIAKHKAEVVPGAPQT
ncbi:MAG: sulfatase [Bryobacteraceae bacterium]|nr:sulfatase [Bryobacteraceae bacterium]